ncbi:hypothetical protein NPIL_571811, partial [Nephila pilipes]
MYPSALSTKINSDVEFSRHLVESRSDKLRQVKSSPIHADFCSEAAIGGKKKQLNSEGGVKQLNSRKKTIQLDRYLLRLHLENQNQNYSRRKTTQLDLHLRSLLRLQNNSTRPPPAQPAPPAKQLNSTSACAACSACAA